MYSQTVTLEDILEYIRYRRIN